MSTQMHTQTGTRVPPQMGHRSHTHRRIMLVTTRCSTLLALQRACRADQAVQFCFYADSVAASRALRRFRPDALLLDVACIGRAGQELVQRVQGMEAVPTVAVLADTVGSRVGEAVEHVGADGGLAVTSTDLLEQLDGLASRCAQRPVGTA